MKVIFSIHIIEEKLPLLKSLGWNITKSKIRQTIRSPKWQGENETGQPTAVSLVNKNHILRVIYKYRKIGKSDIIFVVTVYITRRGRYESTK